MWKRKSCWWVWVGWSWLISAEVCLLTLHNDTLGKTSDLLRTLCVLILENSPLLMLRNSVLLHFPSERLIAATDSSFTHCNRRDVVYPFTAQESVNFSAFSRSYNHHCCPFKMLPSSPHENPYTWKLSLSLPAPTVLSLGLCSHIYLFSVSWWPYPEHDI